MFEHLVTHTFQHALSDHYHHPAVDKCCDDTAQEDRSQYCERHIKFTVIRVLQSDQGDDIIIQKKLQRQRHGYRSDRTDQNTENYHDKLYLVRSCHIFHQALRCLYRSFVDGWFFLLIHCQRLPSPEIHILLCRSCLS